MEDLSRFVDEQLAAWEVPGCAVAAVRGEEVVLATGFGQRDLGGSSPVTARTLFAIGSTTKAFTAATVGSLVDEGLVSWDAPIRQYLPDFRLHDDVVTPRLSVGDLLSHRSGLPRHEFAWLGHPERSRADLVRRLRYLPLSRDLRQEFQYCNLGFLTAGYLVEVLTGTPWEDYLRARVMKPLGMDRSNVSVTDMLAAEDRSKAHERRHGAVVEIPQRHFDEMAPAGAINSCAEDMARWLLVHLGGGRLDGQAVISPGTIARMHAPQMVLPEDRTFVESTRYGYGLGWMIGQYRGHRIVEHGGGIDGFLTECMLLPDDGVGVTVMTNSTSSAMGPVIAYRVLDELLGVEPLDWFARFKARYEAALAGQQQAHTARRVVADAPLPRPQADYAGDYEHPGYGTLSIVVEGGELKPSFGTLPLTLTHRHYQTYDLEWHELGDQSTTFPLMFLDEPDGDVAALTVPFEGSVDPIRFDRMPDPRSQDAEVLAGLTGTYAMGPIELVVALKGDRTLTLGPPGSAPSDLVPGRGLRFSVKAQPSTTVEFELGAGGRVERVVIQPLGVFEPKP